MTFYMFNPNIEIINTIKGNYDIEDFSKETGVFSATPEFVIKNCGLIANTILSHIPSDYYDEAKKLNLYPNIDVRIHRLYPSDYPAYPGWHCDGEYRETYFSQPNLNKIKVSQHIICTVSSHPNGISNPQFLNESLSCKINDEYIETNELSLWGIINNLIEKKKSKNIFDSMDGQIIKFDSWTLHRVMPTKIRGWRLFFRMAMWHKKNLGDGGMIAKQEQVYKLIDNIGW